MMLARIMLGFSIAGVMLADSATGSIKEQLHFANSQIAQLTKANADLRVMNDKLIVENNNLRSHTSLTDQVNRNTLATKEQTQTHEAERGAVEQAQASVDQTLINTSATNKANIETEKQLLDLAKDVHMVVRSQGSFQWLLLIQTLIVLSFTGVVWYLRRPVVTVKTVKPGDMLEVQSVNPELKSAHPDESQDRG